ncbi:PLP-dependent aminotransferase family protein [Candidatus Neomarinimicrobiota bacterium]
MEERGPCGIAGCFSDRDDPDASIEQIAEECFQTAEQSKLDPRYVRIAHGNFIGMMANASSALSMYHAKLNNDGKGGIDPTTLCIIVRTALDAYDLGMEAALEVNNVQACLFSLNCQNPLGYTMPDEKKERLINLLDRLKMPLIEDDVYGDINFGPKRPIAGKAFDRDGFVMLCSSFNKTLAPGFDVGWVAPGKYFQKLYKLKFSGTLGNPPVLQIALARFLESGDYDYYLRRIRRTYETQSQLLIQAIQKYFPPGVCFTKPSGGIAIWVEFPDGFDSHILHKQCADAKIAIAPGSLFSPTGQYRNCFRLHYGNLWSDKIEKALLTIGRLAENQM